MNSSQSLFFEYEKNNENSIFFVKKRCAVFFVMLMVFQSTCPVLPRITASALPKFGKKISSTVLAGALVSKIAGTFKINQSNDSMLESSVQLTDTAIMAVTDASDIAYSVAHAAAGITADVVAPMGIGFGVALYRYKKKQKTKLLLENSEPQTVYDLKNLFDDTKFHQTAEWKYYLAWIGSLAAYKAYKAYKVCQDNSLAMWLSSVDQNSAFKKVQEDDCFEYYAECNSGLNTEKTKLEEYSKDLKTKKIEKFTFVVRSQFDQLKDSELHKATFDFFDRTRKSNNVAWQRPDSSNIENFNINARKHGWFKCIAYHDDAHQYFECAQHRPGYFEHMSKQQILNTFWMIKNKIK